MTKNKFIKISTNLTCGDNFGYDVANSYCIYCEHEGSYLAVELNKLTNGACDEVIECCTIDIPITFDKILEVIDYYERKLYLSVMLKCSTHDSSILDCTEAEKDSKMLAVLSDSPDDKILYDFLKKDLEEDDTL